ncbi:xanthine dehydrogenase family protein molybdopterin-binding subunit [Virgibacillus halophilus]|uniref:xanthine dehydrogenase family protein molybdopterin-binding subunit n=1 Tax=Tigheibacillus halophilus TaxID=361280 RepID=UPI00363100ED
MIGRSLPRKEGNNKVTGAAKYTSDFSAVGQLHAKLITSPHAHANIKSIDTSGARQCPGVRAVITGQDCPILTGSAIEDRPILAIDKVRYFGEPVAAIVADSEYEAQHASDYIKVEYELLPIIHSAKEAIAGKRPLVHDQLVHYKRAKEVRPDPKRNVANHVKVRKGDIFAGREKCECSIETNVFIPQSDHAAMETRAVQVEILPNKEVHIYSSSQAPFMIKQVISKYFMLNENDVVVHTPLVGGAFGGKAAVQLELIAYAASKAVGGKLVKLTNTREDDMVSSPVHIGMNAKVLLGATRKGELIRAEIQFLFDAGAYVDESSDITTTAALNCTGPYKIDYVWCDSYCVYTNHPYATSFRGYGHGELTFAMERALDVLAEKLEMDPVELRKKNTIKPGNTTPTQALLTKSNIGNTAKCLERVKELINWQEGRTIKVSDRIIKAKGVSCLWKTSMSPTNASSGAVITFNKDGSMNLNVGVVEIGQGTKTALTQLLAESMKVDESKIHIMMDIDTQTSPRHWKTVASTGLYMAGNAVLEAAEDVKRQLKDNAAYALRCKPEDLDVGGAHVYLKSNPEINVNVKDVASGYKYENGNAAGRLVIGHGGFVMNHLTKINQQTGEGVPGPSWTVGAQAVEVAFDTKTFFYKITKAVSVIDAGKIINPRGARGQVTGAMSMGLSWASREGFSFDELGHVKNKQFRTYKTLRFDENPTYVVEFLGTPQLDGPYGARGLGEHGIIGMPAALANSLSAAAGVPLNQLPIVPELIWKQKRGGVI